MKNILVVGANGMLSHDLIKVFKEKGYNVSSTTRKDFDITKKEEVKDFFKDKSFDLVINSAAYTQVDKAEEEKELAFLTNEEGARNLAQITSQKNIPIVYISTDYVFDGKGHESYKTCDKTNPINVYGESKLAGEIATTKANPRSYIVRTSWLYGSGGKNFVETMLELAKTKSEIKVVSDQFGCPTWTLDLSRAIEKLFREESEYAIYHLCGVGQTSWYEFAEEVFRLKNIDITVIPIETKEFPRPANRPKYSVLDNNGLIRSWQDSLRESFGLI